VVKIKAQYWVAIIGLAITLTFISVHMVGIARRNARYRRILKSYSYSNRA
jgi:hypothetical protein